VADVAPKQHSNLSHPQTPSLDRLPHHPPIAGSPLPLPVSQSQHPPYAIPHSPLIFWPPLSPHLGCLYVGRALVIGLGKHAHDGYQNLLDRLDGRPSLRCVLVVVRVVAGGVEDGDADESAWVDCRALPLAGDETGFIGS
jgi:hypothetical protein